MADAEYLKQHDPLLLALEGDSGKVLLSPALSGRIFCEVEGALIHRLDEDRLLKPNPAEFNNLGGNSLWPAPEGGKFAFNYPPGDGDWYVQDGVARLRCAVSRTDDGRGVLEKSAALINRSGTLVRVLFRREAEVLKIEESATDNRLSGIRYRTLDTLIPLRELRPEVVLAAPWSLEQFPGADGVLAFVKVAQPEKAVNYDFYGDPRERMSHHEGGLTFRLGGPDRHQIGLTVDSKPELIGALDTNRSLLFLRHTKQTDGTYFNIADNDQPEGPHSARDLYSIFNGGDLGFFELETIGAMAVQDGLMVDSTLESETTILKGSLADLKAWLAEHAGVGFLEEVS